MSKNKLARFAENETFPNLFQHNRYDFTVAPFPLKGRWREGYFKNDHPIVLELGCGRGDYTIALAERFPGKNYIGIDRKGARLWRGCKTAYEQQMDNVAFLRISIYDIENYFGQKEVDEIWITFPDPQPKKPEHRLSSPQFVARYEKFLKKEAVIHLKTDSRLFYEYTRETAAVEQWPVIEDIEDVYRQTENPLLTGIQTFYETMWLKEGRMISYLKFKPDSY